jgi:hypothetical protein
MDNYYKNCPPRMDDGRFTTNYKSASSINEYIKYMNGITRDDDYRLFLQINANKLMDSEWLYLRENDSCWNNACVHQYPLRMDPRLFSQERENANMLFQQKELPTTFKCMDLVDYRMSETPMLNYKIDPMSCNKNQKK